MKKHLLFLGAPGAGKGTQAALLSQINSYLHLSTGELLRKEIEMNTDLGKQVKGIMNKGELVSDQLVLEIVQKNLAKNNKGWILDGFPRNLSQANTVAIIPAAVERATNVQTFQGLGATSLLILVGVAIDTAKQIQTYVISQRYEGLVNN